MGLKDPYEGEPIKEVLIKALKRGLIPETLCFFVLRRCVCIGRGSSLKEKVNLEYCRKEGIPIIRIITGGGGASHDGDVLQCILVSKGKPSKDSIRLSRNFIAEGLQVMGLEPELRPRSNDILMKGRKISGTGDIFTGGISYSVGVLIVDFNYDLCEKVLLPVPETFLNKEANSHREWITTLKAQLGREVSFSEVISDIKEVFETELQIEFKIENSLTEAETQIFEELQEKYRSEEWTKTGRWSPVKDYWRPN